MNKLVSVGVRGAAAVVLACMAMAGAASAARLALNRSCYAHTRTRFSKLELRGTGFAPNGQVNIGGAVAGHLTADASGNIAGVTRAPAASIIPGSHRFRLVASGAGITASVIGHDTAIGVALGFHGVVGFGKRVTYYFGGFRPGRQVYGHYFIGRRLVGRKRFGRAAGPCGTLKAQATGFPVSGAHPVSWTVRWDDSRKLNRHAFPAFFGKFRRVVRSARLAMAM